MFFGKFGYIYVYVSLFLSFTFLKFLFMELYLFERAAVGEGEAGSLLSREPNVELYLRTQGSDLSRRQMLNQLSHPDSPMPLM